MEKLTLTMIAQYSNGHISEGAEKAEVFAISTDSRRVSSGDLFVALKGERFDGHDFLEEAERRGASALMVEKGARRKIPMVFVDDTTVGLQRLAASYRDRFPVRTVAVAGSNGKTGTKELVAAVLGVRFSVLKSEGNLNNHIGVPLGLMRLDASHQLGVFEIGTNHPGELKPLAEMIRPVVGVITTIGEEHLEFFHDLEGVAREEGTLAEMLPREGLLILNADDSWSAAIARRGPATVAYFGFSGSAAYRAERVKMDLDGARFALRTPKGEKEIRLSLIGRHQVCNALAAAAVGEFFGLSLDEIARGLESARPEKMRMERRMTPDDVLILNDAYNANPGSMRAALETLKELPVSGKRIAVLGGMRELGEISAEAHRDLGRRVAKSGLDVLLAVGIEAEGIAEGAREKRSSVQIECFATPAEAAEFLKRHTRRGDAVLVKASRGVALERVLEEWIKE